MSDGDCLGHDGYVHCRRAWLERAQNAFDGVHTTSKSQTGRFGKYDAATYLLQCKFDTRTVVRRSSLEEGIS